LKKLETLWTVIGLVATLLTVPSENWPVLFRSGQYSPEGFLEFPAEGSEEVLFFVVKNGSVKPIHVDGAEDTSIISRPLEIAVGKKILKDSSQRPLIEPASYAIVGPIAKHRSVDFYKENQQLERKELVLWTTSEVNEMALYIVIILLGVCWLIQLLVSYSHIGTVSAPK